MNFAYIRVSCDKQTNENQRFEVTNYTKRKGFEIDEWIEETASGTKKADDRKLGKLLDSMRADDTLYVCELSRLGRNLMEIMSILGRCMERGVKVIAIKEGYELGDNITSKVMAFAFGLSAEIERKLISQRTKEALARKKAQGVVLGRPKGLKSKHHKLTGKDAQIKSLLEQKIAISAIGRIIGVHRLTVTAHIERTPALKKIWDNKLG
jgi:DNA invertase Pin-like site-specific DNA recombinase